VIDSHGTIVDAAHGHTEGAVTRTEPAPPAAGAEPLSDPSSSVHVVPDCETLIVCPAIVSVPIRPVADPAFELMPTPTVWLPVPEVGANTAQGALLDAVQEQFEPFVVIPTVPVAPPEP
jgi:hypothetical protein